MWKTVSSYQPFSEVTKALYSLWSGLQLPLEIRGGADNHVFL